MARSSRKAPSKGKAPKGPRQAAPKKSRKSRKPRQRDYAAEYRARTKGLEPGTPAYQRARGHKPAEHVSRREREQALIEQFAAAAARRNKRIDADEAAADIREGIREHGYGWSVAQRRAVEELNRRYLAAGQPKSGSPKSLGINIVELARQLGTDPELLFYH
jgi:hypothetical protein